MYFLKFLKKKEFKIIKNFFLQGILFYLLFYCSVSNGGYKLKNYQLIKQFRSCLSDDVNKECSQMVILLERMQVEEYKKENFKCQTSLLGMQTEIIRKINSSANYRKSPNSTISYVIKNC